MRLVSEEQTELRKKMDRADSVEELDKLDAIALENCSLMDHLIFVREYLDHLDELINDTKTPCKAPGPDRTEVD